MEEAGSLTKDDDAADDEENTMTTVNTEHKHSRFNYHDTSVKMAIIRRRRKVGVGGEKWRVR